MKKLGIILLICAAGLYGCYAAIVTTGTWRYRLTLTVNDNGTLRTGSSVIQVSVMQGLEFLPESTPAVGVRGEAVAVDLGKKGVLFSLLRSEQSVDYADSIVCIMFPFNPVNPCAESLTPKGIRYYRTLEGKRDVPFEKLPMLVRFRNINDPKTVTKVDPHNLEASFGTGVTLESAKIEMTKGSITTGIQKLLPWLPEYSDKLFDGRQYETSESENRLANSLGAGSFSTELNYGH